MSPCAEEGAGVPYDSAHPGGVRIRQTDARSGWRVCHEECEGVAMNIGSRKIVVDEAIAQLRLYAETNGAVLKYYDGLPGMTTIGGSEPDKVTLEDLARTMVIGSDLRAADIPWLLEVEAEKEFAVIPVDARLEDAAPGTELFEAANALDEKFSGHRGFGQAKKSKL